MKKIRPTIVAVYTKGSGRKYYIKVFTNLNCVDPIIDPKSKKLPPNAKIVDLGVGEGFIDRYKTKYKLK